MFCEQKHKNAHTLMINLFATFFHNLGRPNVAVMHFIQFVCTHSVPLHFKNVGTHSVPVTFKCKQFHVFTLFATGKKGIGFGPGFQMKLVLHRPLVFMLISHDMSDLPSCDFNKNWSLICA